MKAICLEGFELNPDATACIDINECEQGLDDCINESTCENTEGNS